MDAGSWNGATSGIAVIFISTRADDHADEYHRVALAMEALARQQPGFLSMESVRDPSTNRGITVSKWVDESSARAWKEVAEHLHAQEAGRERFYLDYEVIVAEVMRTYAFSR